MQIAVRSDRRVGKRFLCGLTLICVFDPLSSNRLVCSILGFVAVPIGDYTDGVLCLPVLNIKDDA